MGWCVGPSSPRPMESCVYTSVVGAMHDRRDAHRVARVVGEHQERAAVRTETAVHGEAVHDGRHAELAHAVVHVVALEVVGGEIDRILALGVHRTGEVGRTAEHLRHLRAEHVERHLRGGARGLRARDRGAGGHALPARCRPSSAGSSPFMRRSNSAPSVGNARACSGLPDARPLLFGGRARFACDPRRRGCRRERRTAAYSQPSVCARVRDFSGPSASPCADLVPCLLGAPQPMMVLQQMIDGWSFVAARLLDGGGDRVGVVAVDVLHDVPAVGFEALRRVFGEPARRPCRRWRCRCRRRTR